MAGGTNSQIKDQNKTVKKQHEYDKKYYDYQNNQNDIAYEHALQVRDINKQNAQQATDYQNQTASQQWKYQMDLQKQEYKVQKKAYKQSLKDYDKQTEYNSAAAAIAYEAENRKLEEALIQKNFGLQDASLSMGKAYASAGFEMRDLDRQLNFATKDTGLQKDALNIQNKQFEKDKTQITNKEGWDLERIDLKYDQSQSDNIYKRMDAMVAKTKAVGTARAAGREGRSADSEVQSILADYGRKQAQLVDSLVFAQTDTGIGTRETKETASYNRGQKDTQISLNNNQKSRLDLALENTKAAIEISKDKVNSDLDFAQQEYSISKNKINASYDSAKKAKRAAKQKIDLDEYAANLAAHSKVMAKPKYPPALPVPLEIPTTSFPAPTKPQTPPKPIKGALTKTSVWNDVGDVFNAGLQIASIFG